MQYDRKIKYLEDVRNGERVQGAGFVKIEVRDALCRINIQVRGLHETDSFEKPVLLVHGGREGLLCRIKLVGGRGDTGELCLDSMRLGENRISYEELEEIRIPIAAGRELRCKWREQPQENAIKMGEMTRAEESARAEEMKRREETKGAAIAEETTRMGETIRREGAAIAEETTRMGETIRREGAAIAEETTRMEETVRRERAARAEETTRGEKLKGAAREEEARRAKEMTRTEESAGAEKTTRTGETARAEATRRAEEMTRMKGAAREEETQRAKETTRREGAAIAEEARRAEEATRIEGTEGAIRAEEVKRAKELQVTKEETRVEEATETAQAGKRVEKSGNMNTRETTGTKENMSKEADTEAAKNAQAEEITRMGKTGQREGIAEAGSFLEEREIAKEEEIAKRQETINKGEIVRKTGSVDKTNKDEAHAGSIPKNTMLFPLEDKWGQLSAVCPHIAPFGDEREYLSLEPGNFVIFPSRYYRLVNNSFLLHGYHNYEHLILTRMEYRGEVRYYIGVPGNYYEKEKQVALMFGFESFESKTEPAQPGDYGYYMMRVEL